jgi:hypothetical protein
VKLTIHHCLVLLLSMELYFNFPTRFNCEIFKYRGTLTLPLFIIIVICSWAWIFQWRFWTSEPCYSNLLINTNPFESNREESGMIMNRFRVYISANIWLPVTDRRTTLWRVLCAKAKPLSDSTGLPSSLHFPLADVYKLVTTENIASSARSNH